MKTTTKNIMRLKVHMFKRRVVNKLGRAQERVLWLWTLLFRKGDIVILKKVPPDDRCHLRAGDMGKIVDWRGRNGWVWVEFFRVGETQCMRPWEINKVA